MKTRTVFSCLSAVLVLFAGCQSGSESGSSQGQANAPDEQSAATRSQPGVFDGKILQTMDGGGYTYVQLDDGTKQIWAAGPVSEFEVGQRVAVQTTMPMSNFRSEALDRTFELVYFTAGFENPDAAERGHREQAQAPARRPAKEQATPVELAEITKVESGYTVAELWGRQDELGGDEIEVRGQVVKFLPAIMKRNWIHLMDGTGEAESEMITITTSQQAKVGDIILVRGQLSKDVDFGSGYTYELIIQDAAITVE